MSGAAAAETAAEPPDRQRFTLFERRGAGKEAVYDPLPLAQGAWAEGQMRGPAVTGLLAHATERAATRLRPELQPARISFDLFRAPKMVPSTVECTVVRDGRRLFLIDAVLMQSGRAVARSQALFLHPAERPDGASWEPGAPAPAPDPALEPDSQLRLYRGDGDAWTPDADAVGGTERKHIWQYPLVVVDGCEPTGFEAVACISDLTSLVVNWSETGVNFINADVSVAFSRRPAGAGLGIATTARSDHDGISAGSAVLFDERGAFGVSTVTGLAQPGREVHVGRWDPVSLSRGE